LFVSEREINLAWRTVELDKLSYNSIVKRSIIASPEQIETEVKTFLSSSKIQNASKNIYMRTFQTFLNWLHEHGHISDRLNLRKKYYFKIPDNENEIFYDDEIKLLFSHFNKTDREFSILIEFLLLTGFRIGEALSLQWSQIKKNKIILANKVNKTSEFVILSPELLALLEELKPVNKEKVFRWKDTSYSRLNRRLSQACEKLGIEKRERSFHEFRKTFLYKLQRADVPVEIAQKLMRHKNISVTIKNYQLIKDKQLENVMNDYSKSFQKIKED
jgi:integrase